MPQVLQVYVEKFERSHRSLILHKLEQVHPRQLLRNLLSFELALSPQLCRPVKLHLRVLTQSGELAVARRQPRVALLKAGQLHLQPLP